MTIEIYIHKNIHVHCTIIGQWKLWYNYSCFRAMNQYNYIDIVILKMHKF